jgi:hypothetical protein
MRRSSSSLTTTDIDWERLEVEERYDRWAK